MSADDLSSQLIARALEACRTVTDATTGEIGAALRRRRLALYVNIATRGAIAVADVTDEMLKDWPTTTSYAVDAEAHAAGFRAMHEQLIHDHPLLLAAVLSMAYGTDDVFDRIEERARSTFGQLQSVREERHEAVAPTPEPTHDAPTARQ